MCHIKFKCQSLIIFRWFCFKMSGFSGVLQLTDLDDFITPSQVWKVKVSKRFSVVFEPNLFFRNV